MYAWKTATVVTRHSGTKSQNTVSYRQVTVPFIYDFLFFLLACANVKLRWPYLKTRFYDFSMQWKSTFNANFCLAAQVRTRSIVGSPWEVPLNFAAVDMMMGPIKNIFTHYIAPCPCNSSYLSFHSCNTAPMHCQLSSRVEQNQNQGTRLHILSNDRCIKSYGVAC